MNGMADSIPCEKQSVHFTKLFKFLNGEGLPYNEKNVHDAIMQNQAHFRPITKVNVGYIVCAVVFNKDNHVLMMQEAKKSCYKQWYLPAGRLEAGESLVEGVIREVKEETGLNFLPTTLVCVEAQGCLWYRFTFTGEIIGGDLKTPDQADQESLQAQWLPLPLITSAKPSINYPLRSKDVFKIIHITNTFRSTPVERRHTSTLPIIASHTAIVFRLFVVHQCAATSQDKVHMHYLQHSNCLDDPDLPVVALNLKLVSSVTSLNAWALEVFAIDSILVHVYGVINVEYSGVKDSGLFVNILCCVYDKYKGVPFTGSHKVEPEEVPQKIDEESITDTTKESQMKAMPMFVIKPSPGLQKKSSQSIVQKNSSQSMVPQSTSVRKGCNLPPIRPEATYIWQRIDQESAESRKLLQCLRWKTSRELSMVPLLHRL